MKQLCATLSSGNVPKRWPTTNRGIPPDLRALGGLFAGLQLERHKADYAHGISFTKAEAITRVDEAEELFRLADVLAVEHRDVYEAFLVKGSVR